MPASRRARAMILAPRSWPSSPGLATSTRIGKLMSDIRTLFVCPEDLAQRAAYFAKRGVGADSVEQRRHQIMVGFAPIHGRLAAKHVEGALNISIITSFPKLAQLFRLAVFGRSIDAEGFNGFLFLDPVAVYAY